MSPFIKWAGGKRQLIPVLLQHMPSSYNRYFEPFLGAGALFLHLMPVNAFVGDINGSLINLWLQVRDNLENVLKQLNILDAVPCTKERYLSVRERFNLVKDNDSAESAADMLWLNKHCFNGLWRVNKKGDFNVPWNRKTDGCNVRVEDLAQLSVYLKHVNIACRSYNLTCDVIKRDDFVYLDPPYDPVSTTANFTNYTEEGFDEGDQRVLAAYVAWLTRKGAKVLLSNNNTGLIRELYGNNNNYTVIPVNVRRSINSDSSKRKGNEVIIKNF